MTRLVISLGGFAQDLFVNREVRHRFAEPCVLLFQILDPPDLVRLRSTEVFAQAVLGHLRHTNLADRVGNSRALRRQNIYLPQLRYDLFRLVCCGSFQVMSAYNPEADARFSVEAARGLQAGKSLMPKRWLAKQDTTLSAMNWPCNSTRP